MQPQNYQCECQRCQEEQAVTGTDPLFRNEGQAERVTAQHDRQKQNRKNRPRVQRPTPGRAVIGNIRFAVLDGWQQRHESHGTGRRESEYQPGTIHPADAAEPGSEDDRVHKD